MVSRRKNSRSPERYISIYHYKTVNTEANYRETKHQLSYGLPCCLNLPAALTAASDPYSCKSAYDMISPQTNLFSKSELKKHQSVRAAKPFEDRTYWMTPAAWGALVPFRIVHARTSSGPQVK
jgi:hypothetical protein